MLNVDLSLAHFQETPSQLPSGLRSYRHTARFKPPDPSGLHGDLELLASLNPGIDPKELAKLDRERKAGSYLRDRLKGVTLTAFQAKLLATLIEEDYEWHQRNRKPLDLTNIEEHGQRFRVQVKDGDKSKKLSFASLEEAIRCRDRHKV